MIRQILNQRVILTKLPNIRQLNNPSNFNSVTQVRPEPNLKIIYL